MKLDGVRGTRPGRLSARIIAAPLLVAVLVLGGAGYAAATSKAPVKPKPGNYTGFVGAFHLSFKVSALGTKITELTTDFEGTVNCGPPAENAPFFHFPALAISKGSFHGSTSVTYPSGFSPHYTIRGSFSAPTRAAGTINVQFSFPHNALPPCNETSSFSVARAGK